MVDGSSRIASRIDLIDSISCNISFRIIMAYLLSLHIARGGLPGMLTQMIVKERLLEFRDYLGLNTQTLEPQRRAGEVQVLWARMRCPD